MGGGFMLGIQTGAQSNVLHKLAGSEIYEETHTLWRAHWNYQRRDPVGCLERNRWSHLWPSGGWMGGDSVNNYPLLCGDDWGNPACRPYEPYSCIGWGNATVKFFLGTCVDSVDAPVANAIVQAFRTSDDMPVGQVTANNDGTYALGCTLYPGPYGWSGDVPAWSASQQHYLVAYKTGSPDTAGTTVNTLTPTNIDGT